MGFKIGKIFKKIGKGIGKVAKGIAKFASSPLGKVVMRLGLSLITGGSGGLLSKGLGLLGKLGSSKLLKTFSGFAQKFLGPATHLLSKAGLKGLAGFLNQAMSSKDLLGLAKGLIGARRHGPAMDPTTEQMVKENLLQLFAHRHAAVLRRAA
jgi:hypothetical protein